MIDINPMNSLNVLHTYGPQYAQAKANRVHLEEFRKSKKAELMKLHIDLPVSAQEREAYADSEYVEIIFGLKEAVRIEESLRWKLECAKLAIEVYRTESANNRTIDRGAA